jgi:hypothetical protein
MTQRARPTTPRHLLSDVLPDLAAELERLLRNADEDTLAASVPQLAIVDRCRCGDDFCATFYTAPAPDGAYGTSHRCIDLETDDGVLVVDVEQERIVCVEVLFRSAVRSRLREVLGF